MAPGPEQFDKSSINATLHPPGRRRSRNEPQDDQRRKWNDSGAAGCVKNDRPHSGPTCFGVSRGAGASRMSLSGAKHSRSSSYWSITPNWKETPQKQVQERASPSDEVSTSHNLPQDNLRMLTPVDPLVPTPRREGSRLGGFEPSQDERLHAGADQLSSSSDSEGSDSVTSSEASDSTESGSSESSTSWVTWRQTFENVMAIRQVTDEKYKTLMLVTEIGTAAYSELRTMLCDVETQPYSSIIQTLREMYEDHESALIHRHALLTSNQRESQTMTEFFMDLQRIATRCDFHRVANVQDSFLMTAFIRGIKSNQFMAELMRKKTVGTLSARQLLMEARAIEQAESGARKMTHGIQKSGAAGLFEVKQIRESGSPTGVDEKSLGRRDTVPRKSIKHVKMISTMNNAVKPCYIELQVDEIKTNFLLDTSACVSVIDKRTWMKIGKPMLKPVTKNITAFGNTKLKFMGTCKAEVKFKNRSALCEVHVIERCDDLILGRDLIDQLKLNLGLYNEPRPTTIKTIVRNDIGALLAKYEDVFRLGLDGAPSQKPLSNSEATPLVIVPKKDGKVRVCADFKVTVNPQLAIDQYPLPKPDELFQAGGKRYSKLDLKDAFLQLPLDEESKQCMTINTHKGLFQYQSIPFGVASAPAIFQRVMEQMLNGMEGVIIYLDDITLTASTDEDHLLRLEEVLKRLSNYGFRIKKEKCEFLREKIEFLEVESFLGMVQYYGEFIPQLATTAAPLNALRHKDVEFHWSDDQETAFRAIRSKLSEMETLAHYDPDETLVFATDASDCGLGAVVYQRYANFSERVIAYASRALTKAEKNHAQSDKEDLGIVFGVEKF
ncbi:hypothetical protein L596_001009 [Steinernema carpocapsae]|uniref:RNA-directed DNA polymerase n=1 Tax=Steinernema carpocapsae TaxID=34508 RepID=A0A4U8UL24_STECR|nr:hypothetical protein L596_001009 [Steinernema carpocapsae]